ncbi:hypothetical protein ACP4OV_020388 [Aristida adscensionis]
MASSSSQGARKVAEWVPSTVAEDDIQALEDQKLIQPQIISGWHCARGREVLLRARTRTVAESSACLHFLKTHSQKAIRGAQRRQVTRRPHHPQRGEQLRSVDWRYADSPHDAAPSFNRLREEGLPGKSAIRPLQTFEHAPVDLDPSSMEEPSKEAPILEDAKPLNVIPVSDLSSSERTISVPHRLGESTQMEESAHMEGDVSSPVLEESAPPVPPEVGEGSAPDSSAVPESRGADSSSNPEAEVQREEAGVDQDEMAAGETAVGQQAAADRAPDLAGPEALSLALVPAASEMEEAKEAAVCLGEASRLIAATPTLHQRLVARVAETEESERRARVEVAQLREDMFNLLGTTNAKITESSNYRERFHESEKEWRRAESQVVALVKEKEQLEAEREEFARALAAAEALLAKSLQAEKVIADEQLVACQSELKELRWASAGLAQEILVEEEAESDGAVILQKTQAALVNLENYSSNIAASVSLSA